MSRRLILRVSLLILVVAAGATSGFGKDKKPMPMGSHEMWQKQMEWARTALLHRPLAQFVGK